MTGLEGYELPPEEEMAPDTAGGVSLVESVVTVVVRLAHGDQELRDELMDIADDWGLETLVRGAGWVPRLPPAIRVIAAAGMGWLAVRAHGGVHSPHAGGGDRGTNDGGGGGRSGDSSGGGWPPPERES